MYADYLVDIGSKVEAVTIIRQLANSGKEVIIISSRFPELLCGLCVTG